MTEAVRRFHLEEYHPAVAKHLAVTPADGWSLPTSPAEWYLHYHYMVKRADPYGAARLLASSTDTSAYGAALAPGAGTSGRSWTGSASTTSCSSIRSRSRCSSATSSRRFFGTNLRPGRMLDQPGRARAAPAARRRTRTTTGSPTSRQYRPAARRAEAFIATPVFDGPRMVAVMILRFPIEPIAEALSNNGVGGRGPRQDRRRSISSAPT